LLLSDDSIGWPPVLVAADWAPCEYDRAGSGALGVDDETVGLNVTVRCGFGFAGVCPSLSKDGIRGVVSVELDAIAANVWSDAMCGLRSFFLHVH
jgi:hypothetical protein